MDDRDISIYNRRKRNEKRKIGQYLLLTYKIRLCSRAVANQGLSFKDPDHRVPHKKNPFPHDS